ncbi:MAG: hypothetical protein ACJAT2_002195 [Bacteriovoracaceae bacterium]|jgi:hypothetical protein
MKLFFILITLLASFSSSAGIDFSCLKDSTFTSAINSNGSANVQDTKGHVKVDLMAGGKYAFVSGVGPNYLSSAKEFFIVFRYIPAMEEFLSDNGELWLDAFCSSKSFELYYDKDDSKSINFIKVK